jgi:hypothetical protein
LLNDADLDINDKRHEEGSLNAMRDYLTPILMNRESHEILGDPKNLGGETLFFRAHAREVARFV